MAQTYSQRVLDLVKAKHSHEKEFIQAVQEVLSTIEPVLAANSKYEDHAILERIVEPERTILFRVPWIDDQGKVQVNRGYRVEFNSAIGPYKGGLRFHPSVNLGILKFLGFEQVFKNSLTTLPMGGGKGGSDFDPKGNEFTGVLTGKSLNWGGSLIRPEATGYGCVYFAQNMLATRNDDLQGKVCLVSGSGNVAQYTVEKLNELGAKAVTMSDSNGYIYDPDGISPEKLAWVMELKNKRRGRIAEYVKQFPKAQYFEGQRPWSVPCDCAFPSATQNEINGEDARTLIKNGCTLVAEGANMPTDLEGIETYLAAKILYGPAKAANAGGVATSGLEMSQNSQRLSWTREEVDHKLKTIMANIHANAVAHAREYSSDKSFTNYVTGANIAGFVKVADSMIDQGVV